MIDDWEINVEVRACCVKRFIKTKMVSISTNNGCVFIKGELNFTGTAVSEEHIPGILTKLEKDIKYIKGVKDIKLEFKDWRKVDEKWVSLKEV